MPYAPNNADRITITNKTYSQNMDTIFYERFHSKYMMYPSSSNYNFSSYTDSIYITNLDSLIVDMYFITPDSNYSVYDTIVEFDTLFCNVEINGYFYADSYFEPVLYNNIWGKGLGVIKTHLSQPGDPSSGTSGTKLFYYKKGTESCGTPDYTSIDDVVKNNLKIFPNPMKDNLTIELEGLKVDEILLYNTLGRMVYRLSKESNLSNINTSLLPVGVYFVKIKSGNLIFTEKVCKI